MGGCGRCLLKLLEGSSFLPLCPDDFRVSSLFLTPLSFFLPPSLPSSSPQPRASFVLGNALSLSHSPCPFS